jgi:coenzyme F420-0:L-glutamate ligase/coenzyme F420-1:gamma-L-glutamate ligase
MNSLHVFAVENVPQLYEGDGLADLISEHAQLQPGDVVIISSTAVSIVEGQVVVFDRNDDDAFADLVRAQSVRTLRQFDSHVVAETAHGFVCVDAGVSKTAEGNAVLLPRDPDRSAFKMRERIRATTGAEIAVVIGASFERAWRTASVGVALGSSGITPVVQGQCVVDQLAAAACFHTQNEQSLVCVIRGVNPNWFDLRASGVKNAVLRRSTDDHFR